MSAPRPRNPLAGLLAEAFPRALGGKTAASGALASALTPDPAYARAVSELHDYDRAVAEICAPALLRAKRSEGRKLP